MNNRIRQLEEGIFTLITAENMENACLSTQVLNLDLSFLFLPILYFQL